MNKGGAKKFQFGFPSKKSAASTSDAPVEAKRKAPESSIQNKETVKRPRAFVVDDDQDELLASAGIGKKEPRRTMCQS